MKLHKSVMVLFAGLISVSACTNNSPTNFIDLQQNTDNISSSSVNSSAAVVEIKLKPANNSLGGDLIKLSTKGLDLFGFNAKTRTIRARVTKEQQKLLKDNKFTFNMILENNMDSKGLLPGYLSYDQMKAKLQALAAKNPEIATLNDIGDSWEKTQGKAPNNDIWCINITSKKNAGAKPASLFIGGMHARELAPPEIMYKLAETLITGYGKDPAITELVDTRDISIVPIVNVDGRKQVEQGNNWQRKNTHGQGVDLNRNFDSHWNYQGLNVPSNWVGDSTNPGSETYSGTSAASEPETQAIQNYYNVKKLNMVLDMHSYGEMFFWPVGYSDQAIPEVNLFKNIYENTFKKIEYQGGTSMSLLYPTTATTDDYAYVKHHALGLGMEIGQSFRPAYSEVDDMWNKFKPNLLTLIKVSNTSLASSKVR